MSGHDRIPEPPHDTVGRRPDLYEHAPGLGWRHRAAVPGTVPDQWATYRLVTIAARLNERRLNRRLSKLGLTTSAFDALETAAELEPATVTDLAALLCVSSQSLGKLLRRLQSLGLLTRERGRDGRSVDIRLTPKGRDVLSTAEDLVRAAPNGEAQDEALFRRLLEQHIESLSDAELSTAPRQGTAYRHARTDAGAGRSHNPSPIHYTQQEHPHGYN